MESQRLDHFVERSDRATESRRLDRVAERLNRDQERVSNSLLSADRTSGPLLSADRTKSSTLWVDPPTKTPTSNQEIYCLEGKVCSTCYKFKYLYDYYRESKSPDGFKAKCKKCLYTVKRKHYEKNKEKYKECYKRFLEKNPNYQSNYYFLKIKKKNIN